MKKLWAEFFGTFALVLAGAGAIVINDVSGGAIVLFQSDCVLNVTVF